MRKMLEDNDELKCESETNKLEKKYYAKQMQIDEDSVLFATEINHLRLMINKNIVASCKIGEEVFIRHILDNKVPKSNTPGEITP